jgi:hypothetical protein
LCLAQLQKNALFNVLHYFLNHHLILEPYSGNERMPVGTNAPNNFRIGYLPPARIRVKHCTPLMKMQSIIPIQNQCFYSRPTISKCPISLTNQQNVAYFADIDTFP